MLEAVIIGSLCGFHIRTGISLSLIGLYLKINLCCVIHSIRLGILLVLVSRFEYLFSL